jgi:zinc protease
MTFFPRHLKLGGAGRRRLWLLIAFLAASWLGLAAIPLQAAEDGNLFNKVVEHKLANGLQVLLLQESRAPIITLQVWYRVGSRNEALGKTGISHLAEHMMFKGTAKYGPKYFSREVQKVGGTDNAFTSRNYTAYFETGPKDQLREKSHRISIFTRGLRSGKTRGIIPNRL